MNVTVIRPLEVLEISHQRRLQDMHVSVEPGDYQLIEIPNPYQPGARFFALPDTKAGAVRSWWKVAAQQGLVKINFSDEPDALNQEQIFKLLSEATNINCLPARRLKIFELLFPDFSSNDRILQNPELAKNIAGGILYNLLFDNVSGNPNDTFGLMPLIVAVLCERTSLSPFSTIDWEMLKKMR